MFYCDNCADNNKYPNSIMKSFGKCEICGFKGICNDTPSTLLPKSNGDRNVVSELVDLIEKKNVKVVFGLEAQGHIPTIEKIIKETSGFVTFKGKEEFVDMTYDKYTWEKIGKEIGWCSFTACLHYFRYLNNKNK